MGPELEICTTRDYRDLVMYLAIVFPIHWAFEELVRDEIRTFGLELQRAEGFDTYHTVSACLASNVDPYDVFSAWAALVPHYMINWN